MDFSRMNLVHQSMWRAKLSRWTTLPHLAPMVRAPTIRCRYRYHQCATTRQLDLSDNRRVPHALICAGCEAADCHTVIRALQSYTRPLSILDPSGCARQPGEPLPRTLIHPEAFSRRKALCSDQMGGPHKATRENNLVHLSLAA